MLHKHTLSNNHANSLTQNMSLNKPICKQNQNHPVQGGRERGIVGFYSFSLEIVCKIYISKNDDHLEEYESSVKDHFLLLFASLFGTVLKLRLDLRREETGSSSSESKIVIIVTSFLHAATSDHFALRSKETCNV